MRRIVVAGAGGYIGSRVLARLGADPDVAVLGVGRGAEDSREFRRVDVVGAPALLTQALRDFRPTAVVNCVGTTSTDLRTCVDAHVNATANVLAAMGEAAAGSRLVQLGSAAEYGQAVPEPLLISEDAAPIPIGAYAVSKLASTLLAVTHASALGLECVALRVFNLLGPDMSPGTIVPKVQGFLAQRRRESDEPIELGSIGIHRDFVDVDDVVSAIVAAVHAPPEAAGSIINIASGQAVMVRDLVRAMLDAAGHRGAIRETASGSGRSPAVHWQRADITRARRLLGWTPSKRLEQSIAEMVGVRAGV